METSTVRVVAGESLGVRAVIETRTPIFYLDFMLKPGGKVVQPVARDFNAFAYVIEGPVLFGNHLPKSSAATWFLLREMVMKSGLKRRVKTSPQLACCSLVAGR